MTRFSDKVVTVTGAAGGIGSAIAMRFAKEGASVVVVDRDRDGAHAEAEALRGLGLRALAMGADVTDEDAVAAVMDQVVATFRRLDILVNNAGIGETDTPIEQRDSGEWNKVLGTNLNSVFYGIKHAGRVMKAADNWGTVVNNASVLGLVGFLRAPAYTAAKHAVVGLTKAAALELAPRIRVVAVAPAFVRTKLIAGLEEAVLPLHPMRRLGEADEVAPLIAYLASDEAGYLTGVVYPMDGGYTAR